MKRLKRDGRNGPPGDCCDLNRRRGDETTVNARVYETKVKYKEEHSGKANEAGDLFRL